MGAPYLDIVVGKGKFAYMEHIRIDVQYGTLSIIWDKTYDKKPITPEKAIRIMAKAGRRRK